jgi:hypothetical protein
MEALTIAYHRNEMSSVNTFHECKLYNRLRTSEQSFVSVYRAYSMSTDTSLLWICKV